MKEVVGEYENVFHPSRLSKKRVYVDAPTIKIRHPFKVYTIKNAPASLWTLSNLSVREAIFF